MPCMLPHLSNWTQRSRISAVVASEFLGLRNKLETLLGKDISLYNNKIVTFVLSHGCSAVVKVQVKFCGRTGLRWVSKADPVFLFLSGNGRNYKLNLYFAMFEMSQYSWWSLYLISFDGLLFLSEGGSSAIMSYLNNFRSRVRPKSSPVIDHCIGLYYICNSVPGLKKCL